MYKCTYNTPNSPQNFTIKLYNNLSLVSNLHPPHPYILSDNSEMVPPPINNRSFYTTVCTLEVSKGLEDNYFQNNIASYKFYILVMDLKLIYGIKTIGVVMIDRYMYYRYTCEVRGYI